MGGRKVGVLFSGGLDSTYLIWKNLKEGNIVYPFYFEITNNGGKPKLEKNRIELIRDKFNKEFDHRVESIKYTIELGVHNFSDTIHLQQVPIWILGLIYSQYDGLDEFQIGYVMNDDAVSYIDDFKNIYNSFSPIVDRMIPLSFPLLKQKKYIMLEELPSQYKDLIVSCENPHVDDEVDGDGILHYRPCGSCVACRRIMYERPHRYLDEHYKRNLFRESMNKVRDLGKCTSHTENNRFYVTVEMEDESPMKAFKPKQLKIDFDGREEDMRMIINCLSAAN